MRIHLYIDDAFAGFWNITGITKENITQITGRLTNQAVRAYANIYPDGKTYVHVISQNFQRPVSQHKWTNARRTAQKELSKFRGN